MKPAFPAYKEIRTLDNVTHLGETEFTYDLRNNVTKIANEMGGRTLAQRYYYTAIDGRDETQRYAKENLPTRYLMSNDRYIDYSYDSLNRLNKKSLTTETPYIVGYSYKMSDRNKEGETLYRTTQISTEANGTTSFSYNYDKLGNITLITKGQADGQGSKTSSGSGWRSYEYDNLNQLVRENNKTTNETYVYTYDDYGNITSKEIHSLLGTDSEPSEATRKSTIAYTYGANGNAGWSKLLTSYNGEAISYDAIGNPTSYRGATLTWDARQLKKYVEGNTTVNYKYDADGLRSSKTVNGATSTYQYVDGQLLYEDRNGNDLYYYYDSYGTPTAIVYCSASGSTNTVYIATNSLGDVIGLYDKNGTQIVKYEYDAWGNVVAETDVNGNALTGTAKTWSEINPFRYRGYYYDSETELYYLQSRYYDAEVGRFISTDGQIAGVGGDVLGYNSYAYCQNNPVNMTDEGGNWPNWSKLASGLFTAAVGMLAVAAVVTACACASPVIAAVTAVAGFSAMVMGGSEINESFTGYNPVKEHVFRGNEQAYEMTKTVVTFTASMGSSSLASAACFVAGTLISGEEGLTCIEDIGAGDKVWATNPETGETELKKVVQTFVNETNELVHVYVNNEEIITTPEHPFYVSNHGWVGAINLRAGDKLVLVNGEYAVVEKISHEILEQPIKVYNFEVEDFHTYYVSDIGVLVHNVCEPYNQLRKTTAGTGFEAHHIVEKRFAETLGLNSGKMLSTPLSRTAHQAYTKAWRDALPYGGKYGVERIWEVAQTIYANNSELLEAARITIFGG